MRSVALCCLMLAAAAGQPVGAAGLVDAWVAAQGHDLEFAAARAAHDAGDSRRGLAAALWRPNLVFTGSAGRARSDTTTTGAQFSAPGFGQSNDVGFDTSINNGNATRWALQLRQPLVSRERDVQRRQIELSSDAAELAWRAAQQDLMLRTAERNADVLLASESLGVLRRQQASVERAAAEARDRFRLGDLPVTDTHEATARAEAIKAQVLAARTQLQLAQAALADVTGAPESVFSARTLGTAASPVPLPELEIWLADVRRGNLQLRMQAAATETAREEVRKLAALASPSLDLVASVARDRLSGSGDFGPATNRAGSAMVGLQLTVPLYSGGERSAKRDEAVHLADKAAADAERLAQQMALQTRSAWLGLSVGGARVAALAESLKATRARLDATRLGRRVGDRTTLELLNAENDEATADLALLRARVALLLDRLRLEALAGQLDEARLRAVDAALAEPG